MPRPAHVVAGTSLALALTLGSSVAASAKPAGDPNRTRTANPAQACAAIPATLAQFGVTPTGFDWKSCVRTVAGKVPNLPSGSPYDQCARLEAGMQTPDGFLQISYPYTFHAEPGDPFPNLRAHNRQQCARALYAFHTIESYLPAPPPGA